MNKRSKTRKQTANLFGEKRFKKLVIRPGAAPEEYTRLTLVSQEIEKRVGLKMDERLLVKSLTSWAVGTRNLNAPNAILISEELMKVSNISSRFGEYKLEIFSLDEWLGEKLGHDKQLDPYFRITNIGIHVIMHEIAHHIPTLALPENGKSYEIKIHGRNFHFNLFRMIDKLIEVKKKHLLFDICTKKRPSSMRYLLEYMHSVYDGKFNWKIDGLA